MADQFYSVDDYERELAKRWGIPEGLVRAMTTQESGRNDAAVGLDTGKGRGRARGRYQLLESTAREMGVKDINDPFENVYGGLKYLKQGYEKAKPHFQDEASRWGAALTHYHAGPDGLNKAIKTGQVPESPDATKMTTRGHVRKIMNAWGGDDAVGAPEELPRTQPQAPFAQARAQGRASTKAPAKPRPPVTPVKGPVLGTQPQRKGVDWWEIAKQQQQPTPSAPGTVQKPAPPMPTENPEVIKERAAYERMGPLEKAYYTISRGLEGGQATWSKALQSWRGGPTAAPPLAVAAMRGPGRRPTEEEIGTQWREQAERNARVTSQAAPGYLPQVGMALGGIIADAPYYATAGGAGQALVGGATAATKLGQLGLAALRGLPAAGAVAARQGTEGWRERPLESTLETVTSAAIPEIGRRLAGPAGRLGERLLGAPGRVAGQVGGAALGGGLTEAAQELAVSVPTRGLNPQTVNEALVAAGAGAILGTSGGVGASRRTPRAADPKAQEIVDAVRPQAEAEPEAQATPPAPAATPAAPTPPRSPVKVVPLDQLTQRPPRGTTVTSIVGPDGQQYAVLHPTNITSTIAKELGRRQLGGADQRVPTQPTLAPQSPVAPQQEGAVPTAPPVPAALTPPEAPKVPRGLQFFYGNEPMDAIAEDNWGSYTVQVPNAEGDLEPVVVGWNKSIHGERPSRVVQEEAQQAATAYAQARRAEAAAAAQAAMAPPQATPQDTARPSRRLPGQANWPRLFLPSDSPLMQSQPAPAESGVGVEPAQQVAPQNTLDALRDALVRRPARAPNTPPMTPLPVTQGVAPQGLVDVPTAPEVDVESDIEPEIAPEPVTTYLPPTDPIRQMVAQVAEQTGLEGRPLYQAVLKQMEAAPDDDTATSIFKAVFRREVAPQERTIPTVEPAPAVEAAPQDAAAQVPGQKKKMSEPRTPEELARIEEYFAPPETPVEERDRIADLIDAPTGKAEVPADMLRSGRPDFDLTPPPPSRVKGETGAYAEALHHRQKTIDDAGYDAELPAFSDSPKVRKALYLDEKASKKQVHTRLRQAMAAYKQVPVEQFSLSTATREDFENFAKRNDLGPGTVEWQSLQAALNTGQAKIDAARAKVAEKQARLDAELSRKADVAARKEQAKREKEAQKGKPKTAEEDLTLYGFVVRNGGIKPSKANRGEAKWLSESGNKRRMFSKDGSYSLDDMREMARQAGFGEFETEADFIAALERADKVRSTARSQSAIDDQLEREWREHVEKNWGDDDINLSANRPVVDIPVAGLAEKRGNVWGTERVDLANAPAEQVQEDVLSNARSEYRAKPNRQGVLWGNHQASLMLYIALRNIGANVVPFNGARLTVGTARRAADMLLDSDVPAAQELGDALVNAAQDAAARGSRSVVFVDSTAPNEAGRASLRKTVGLVRHEFFHVGVGDAEARMTMGVRWAEDPDAPRVSAALRRAGYTNDPALLEEESIAHIIEGAWGEAGFENEQQAVNYLKRAFKRLIQSNGLDKFERMTMRVGPVAGKVAKDAKIEASAEASAQSVGADQGIAGPTAAGRPGGAVQQPQGGIRQGDAVGRVQEGGRDAGAGVQAAVGDQVPSQQQERAVAGLGRQPAPVYFSALQRFVEKLPDGKVNAAQLLAQLDKPQSGVKQDELKWTGLKQWLTDNAGKPLTKQQVVDFVKQNQVEVREVLQGGMESPAIRKLRARSDDATRRAEDALIADDLFTTTTYARRVVREEVTRWGSIDQIGVDGARPHVNDAIREAARAYRALMSVLPDDDRTEYGQYRTPGKAYHELVFTLPAIEGPSPKHFQDAGKNQVAHGRAQEIEVDGKRVYNVVEVQSDWHQAAMEKDPKTGERKGYATGNDAQLKQRLDEIQDELRRLLPPWRHGEMNDADWAAANDRINELDAERREIWARRGAMEGEVPDAPFQKTWPELVIKKMLRMAAENDFDSLAWDAGAVHIDRYPQLTTVAKRLEYLPDANLLKTYHPEHGERKWTVDKAHTLTDYVGAEMAERLMASPAKSEVSPPVKRYVADVPDGLRVGDKGMRKFYDEILVNSINKYVKQWGAKVYPIERKLPDGKPHKMWAIDITPQMRDSVVYEGQPLFRVAAKVLNPDGTEREVMLAAAGPTPQQQQYVNQFLYPAQAPQPQQANLPGTVPPPKVTVKEVLGAGHVAAQLLNPRFFGRNIAGHLSMAGGETAAHLVAAMVDATRAKITKRGRFIGTPAADQAAAFGKGLVAGAKISTATRKRGVYYGGQLISTRALEKVFGKAGGLVEDGLWFVNQLPDDMMYHAYLAAALRNMEKIYQGRRLRGVTPMDIYNQARREADRAALRDKNFVSQGLGTLKAILNGVSEAVTDPSILRDPSHFIQAGRKSAFGLGDLVIKYTQIPGAILKRAIEYSPLGLIQVAHELGAFDKPLKTTNRTDMFRVRNAELALGRVVVGSGAGLGIGMLFGLIGAITPEEEEGKEQAELDREEGKQAYALNLSAFKRWYERGMNLKSYWANKDHEYQQGDVVRSLDWLQPAGMLMAAGAHLVHSLRDKKAGGSLGEYPKIAWQAVSSLSDAFTDTSVLRQLQRYLGNERVSFGQALLYTIQDLPSSFVPQLAVQAKNFMDAQQADPKLRHRQGVDRFVSEMLTKAIARTPLGTRAGAEVIEKAATATGIERLRELALPRKLDTFGKPVERRGAATSTAGRAVETFISPSNTTRFQPKPISQAMRQADKVAGAPRFQAGSDEKGPGETPAQWRERTQVKGQLLEKAGNAMAESYAFKQAPAEIQKRMTEVFLKRLSGGGSLHPGSIHSEARSQSLKEAREKVLGISSPQETLKQQKRMLNRFQ